ncbi:hypothetical protein E4U42_003900 [Claviceps africana]|uniref:Uncharacterized protein n=1 Tax=Claviceps africana TaxID=83212 RepID=A0A8K0J6A2_9HYPO|nr:hypothetical protein E4U42_003900 [Claviceps africana]
MGAVAAPVHITSDQGPRANAGFSTGKDHFQRRFSAGCLLESLEPDVPTAAAAAAAALQGASDLMRSYGQDVPGISPNQTQVCCLELRRVAARGGAWDNSPPPFSDFSLPASSRRIPCQKPVWLSCCNDVMALLFT